MRSYAEGIYPLVRFLVGGGREGDRFFFFLWTLICVSFCVVVYFNGYSKKILDKTYKPEGEIADVLVLYNESRKKVVSFPRGGGAGGGRGGHGPGGGGRRKRIFAHSGLTDDTISEDFIIDKIARVNYPQTRVVLLNDMYVSNEVFDSDVSSDIPPTATRFFVLCSACVNSCLFFHSFFISAGVFVRVLQVEPPSKCGRAGLAGRPRPRCG
jgi:hypothetical protein